MKSADYPPGRYLLVYDFETRFEPHGIDPGAEEFLASCARPSAKQEEEEER